MSFGESAIIHASSEPLPVLSWAKSGSHWDVQYPYINFAWRPANSNGINLALNQTAWTRRQQRAIWRGSTTGTIYTAHNWNTTRRSRLVAMCKKRADLCDAQFTGAPLLLDPTSTHLTRSFTQAQAFLRRLVKL